MIPGGFEKSFSKVSVLDLSYNKLTGVPESLGNMRINKLQLANNKLSELPDGVWGNENVFYLELDNNNISDISVSVKSATSLTNVLISNNSMTETAGQTIYIEHIIQYIT